MRWHEMPIITHMRLFTGVRWGIETRFTCKVACKSVEAPHQMARRAAGILGPDLFYIKKWFGNEAKSVTGKIRLLLHVYSTSCSC